MLVLHFILAMLMVDGIIFGSTETRSLWLLCLMLELEVIGLRFF